MATVNLGRIKFVWQGAYSGATAYVADDVVSYSGSSYICILASTNNLPTNTTYWNLMAQTGTDITSLAGLAQGDVLYYNGTSWVRLGAGTSGQYLKTNGASANPAWANGSTSTLTTQGDVLYRDASGLQRLGAGTSGQFLKTNGSGANPAWATVQAGVLALTSFQNSTRTSLSANSTPNYEMWNGTVNRTSATSNMLMQFVIPFVGLVNNPNIGQFCKLNSTRQRFGVEYNGGAPNAFVGNSYYSSAVLGATTGSINWAIGWNMDRNISPDTSSATTPSSVWNYNSSDDGRGLQSGSQLIIWELGV